METEPSPSPGASRKANSSPVPARPKIRVPKPRGPPDAREPTSGVSPRCGLREGEF